jgi:endonuclease III
MRSTERATKVMQYFAQHLPKPETELQYRNPFELLTAVILSAQCTDKRVNLTTPALFERYPTPALLADASIEDVFGLIKSISYPNNKAKHLVGMAQLLVRDHHGEVPETMAALTSLPGVGRKTANVILSVVFRQQDAIAVDTHVFRVARRLGLVTATADTPFKVEEQLRKLLPTIEKALPGKVDVLGDMHHWLILHGRYTCHARKPDCSSCGLQASCKYFPGSPAVQAKLDAVKPSKPGKPSKLRRQLGRRAGGDDLIPHSTRVPEAQ